jgi:hypothetical protein
MLVSTWHGSARAIARDAWNTTAAAAGFYLSYDWLLGQESRTDGRMTYLAINRVADGRLVAGIAFNLVERESNELYRPAALGLGPDEAGAFGLIGSRRGYRTGVIVDTRDVREAAAARELLGAGIREFALRHGVNVYALYVPDEELPTNMGIPGCVESQHVGTEAVLPLPDDGYPGVVHVQASRRRRTLLRERRRFLEVGYRVGLEPLAGLEEQVATLLHQVETKYGSQNPLSHYRFYYDNLVRSADAGHVLTCRLDGTLVGFCHFYTFNAKVWCRSVGFDYERLRDRFEYFNLVFHELGIVARGCGATAIHLGMDSLQAKLNHGAIRQNLWGLRFSSKTD